MTRRRLWLGGLVAVATLLLFYGYLRMARVQPTNSDGASIALQAWDMLHGNVLLRGWNVADVSFYTTDMLLLGGLETVFGLSAEVVHVGAALTYLMLVLAVALVAKGRARGAEALLRMGLAVLLMLVPAPGNGYLTLLTGPDHTGTALPVLVAWLLVERWPRRFMPVAVALLLGWAQVGDALVTYIAAVPLALVAAWRLLRAPADTGWRARLLGLDGQLLLAAVASVLVHAGLLGAVRAAGGLSGTPMPVALSPLSELWSRTVGTGRGIAALFGGYLPERHGFLQMTVGVLHLVAVPLLVVAFGVAVRRLARHRSTGDDDRVTALLAVGIAVNLGAYLFSTLPADLPGSREIVAVLPFGSALVGRVCGPWLLRAGRLARPARLALVALVAVACVNFTSQTLTSPGGPGNAAGTVEAGWLLPRGYTYGLGTYWTASSLTLASHGKVHVVPVTGIDPYRPTSWESRDDWYDPARHDARFLLLDTTESVDLDRVAAQFGPPVLTHKLGPNRLVLIYDHNILSDLAPLPGS
jgi:hypothetical protein